MKFGISSATRTACIVVAILGAVACNNKKESIASTQGNQEPELTAEHPRLLLHTGDASGLDFVNQIDESFDNNPATNINIYNGGGVATADFNLDGLPDLYFISCNGPNKLFLNEGHFKFKDISKGSGLESPDGFETSVTVVDINTDGLPDLYVGRAGTLPLDQCRNRLFVNNGNLTFTEKAAEYGLDVECRTTGANFFDYDNDGDLDVYILNYPQSAEYTSKVEAKLNESTQKYEAHLEPKTPYDSDRLYRNNGNGTFTNVSDKAGIHNLAYGLSVTTSDFNGDGYTDIYVGNDFIQPDILYINNRNGAFTNQINQRLKHSTQHTMGMDIADVDNDQLVDLVGLDMLPAKHYRQKSTLNTNTQNLQNTLEGHGYFNSVVRNVLQHNNGNGTFSDVACAAGMYKTDWSWSSLFVDFDNDGFKDLAVTNGYRREVTDMDFVNFTAKSLKAQGIKTQFKTFEDYLNIIPTYKLCNYVYRNKGDGGFESMGGNWLTVPPSWSNGAVYADFDADGDMDWVCNNLVDKPFLYENLSRTLPASNYLQLKLVGNAPNTFAVGASATIRTASGAQYQELNPTRGLFSSVEHLLHFGIGNNDKIEEVLVRWPNGQTTTLKDVPANQRLTLKQSEANGHSSPKSIEKGMFVETDAGSGIDFKHVENEYFDFNFFFLQPWQESELGPMLTKGDVNGDGLEDLYIGGAFGQSSALYIQTPDGKFRQISQETWKTDMAYEDHGAVFFDADKDGDLDLFVISGGYEGDQKFADIAWQNRLYINIDGKGNFGRATNALPKTEDIGGRVCAFDYDGDGDSDLFIGGRLKASGWPITPRSTILRNDLNHFTDVTAEVGPGFEHCGMVSDLSWADLDGDAKPELIVTGEWMPILVFKLANGQLKTSPKTSGWVNPTACGTAYRYRTLTATVTWTSWPVILASTHGLWPPKQPLCSATPRILMQTAALTPFLLFLKRERNVRSCARMPC